jgi:hypothetical protein
MLIFIQVNTIDTACLGHQSGIKKVATAFFRDRLDSCG